MRLILISLIFLLSACASPHRSTGPKFSSLSNPEDGEAVIYILRPANFLGSAIWPNLFINGRRVADPKNGTFTTIKVAPGHYRFHTIKDPQFWAAKDWSTELIFDAAAGTRYFVKLHLETSEIAGITFVGGNAYGTKNYVAKAQDLRLLEESAALLLLRELQFEQPVVSQIP